MPTYEIWDDGNESAICIESDIECKDDLTFGLALRVSFQALGDHEAQKYFDTYYENAVAESEQE